MLTAQALPETVPARDASDWQWPIDLSRYDWTPTLAPTELAALVALGWDVRRRRDHNPQRPEWAAIVRLVKPLDEARLAIHRPAGRYHERSSLDAVGIILHRCAMTQRPFWAWNAVTWIEDVLAPSQQAFQRAYPGWIDGAVRPYLVGIAYLLDCFTALNRLRGFNRIVLANRVFSPGLVQQAVAPIMATLCGWGYHTARHTDKVPGLVSALLLYNRSPYLADLTAPVIEHCRCYDGACPSKGAGLYGVHRAIAALGFVDPPVRSNGLPTPQIEGIDSLWQEWVERWIATSTLTLKVRQTFRTILFKVGRWLMQHHPDIREPAQWTRELCAAYVAQVERMCVGDYVQRRDALGDRVGRPLSARTKAGYIVAVRTFFSNCQEWEWIPRRFDPARALATPRSILALTGPNPRVIADDIWAKLLWAGLNLEVGDLPANNAGEFYPLELVRAMALVWLFAGLRSDEMTRLRLGCIRWQDEAGHRAGPPPAMGANETICLLDVPTHKTGAAFTDNSVTYKEL